jgi:hypothetical protein
MVQSVGRTGVCRDNAVADAVTRRSATSLPFLGSRTILNLGFDIPEVNDSGGDGSFCHQMSAEDLMPLDVDVLVWVISSDEALDGVLNRLPTRPALAAFAEGREVLGIDEEWYSRWRERLYRSSPGPILKCSRTFALGQRFPSQTALTAGSCSNIPRTPRPCCACRSTP